MPIYVFKCEDGHTFDEFLKISEYDTPMTCQCGKPAKRQIVPTMLNMDMPNWDRYISPTTGKLITSYKQRKADMAASGCVDYEPSLKHDISKKIGKSETKMDSAVDAFIEKEIEQMPSEKREKLGNELENLDLNVVRQTA